MLNYLSVEKEDCSHLGFPYGINYDRLDMISTLISVILVCSCVCVYVSVSVLVNVCVCVWGNVKNYQYIQPASIIIWPWTLWWLLICLLGKKYIENLSLLNNTHTHNFKSYCSLSAWLSCGANVMNHSATPSEQTLLFLYNILVYTRRWQHHLKTNPGKKYMYYTHHLQSSGLSNLKQG